MPLVVAATTAWRAAEHRIAVQTETMQCYASTIIMQVGQRLRVHSADLGNRNS